MPARKTVDAPREGAESFLVPAGLLVALVLPFFVWLADSPDQLRDSKLAVQALGASVALAGLLFDAIRRGVPFGPLGGAPAFGRVAVLALSGALALSLVSGLARSERVDPLTAAAVLSPLALAVAGASRSGAAAAPRLFGALAVAGAATGLLAAGQRYLGGLRIIPIDAPEPRFLAVALIGNPGDVAAALLLPALVCWVRMTGTRGRARLLPATGLGACLLGLGATEAIAPLGAFAAAVLLHTLLDLRTRIRPLLAAVLLFAAAAGATGAGRRALEKLDQLRRGDTAVATTQRDIGALAAVEMIRARPLLGVGPGAFSNVFVPARLRAEERVGRRLIHFSGSSHFENAHSEPLTLAAENGLPAAILALLGFLAAGAGLFRLHLRRTGATRSSSVPPDALIAFFAAFAVLSLASFPLRLALSAGPLAFAFGVAIRALSGRREEERPAPRAAIALGVLALLTLGTAVVRFTAVSLQADGELRLNATPSYEGAERAALNDSARRQIRRALALRPRSASAWIALGSTYRLDREMENAFLAYVRSLTLEERAETDFNIGLVVLAGSAPGKAPAFFQRAVWILPRLAESLPPAIDAEALVRTNEETAARLGAGARPPELPDGLTPRI